MKNSTVQQLKFTSSKLTDRTPNFENRQESGNKIVNTNYLTHDFNNLYRTSYNDMDQKVNILNLYKRLIL